MTSPSHCFPKKYDWGDVIVPLVAWTVSGLRPEYAAIMKDM
jgi:hypothetical protein